MSYRGLYARLFVISALFLAALVGGLLLFQMRYFGSIYTAQKETQFFAAMQAARDALDGRDLSLTDQEDYLTGVQRTSGAGSLSVYAVSQATGLDAEVKTKQMMAASSAGALSDSNADEVAATFLKEMLSSGALPDQPREEAYTLGKQAAQYAVFLQTLTMGGQTCVMIGVASLQPVDEAVRLLSQASWLVFGAAMLVSLALSAVIAAAVAQPLIREVAHEKALDARRREFIAHASHELKTPLSIISSYAESLLDDVVAGGERRGYEQVIFDETQRMAHLVREMLEVSRLQDARVALQRTEVRLAARVEQALQRCARRVEEKQIAVTLENKQTTAILADAGQLDLVLDNLISNAIYHTPPGGRIRVGLADAPGGARCEIENEGEPIPEALLERIWDSFFRADQAHQREDGRYGLGLSIVKLGVEKHGGRVGVRNTASGVLFFFELPAG